MCKQSKIQNSKSQTLVTSHAEEGPLNGRVWYSRGSGTCGLTHWSGCSFQNYRAPSGHWKVSVHLAVLIAFGLLLPPPEKSLMDQLDAKDAPILYGVLAVTASPLCWVTVALRGQQFATAARSPTWLSAPLVCPQMLCFSGEMSSSPLRCSRKQLVSFI